MENALRDAELGTDCISRRTPASMRKLEVTSPRGAGRLTGVTTIQRLNTKGGVSEGPCEQAGDVLSVPCLADYTFSRTETDSSQEGKLIRPTAASPGPISRGVLPTS